VTLVALTAKRAARIPPVEVPQTMSNSSWTWGREGGREGGRERGRVRTPERGCEGGREGGREGGKEPKHKIPTSLPVASIRWESRAIVMTPRVPPPSKERMRRPFWPGWRGFHSW